MIQTPERARKTVIAGLEDGEGECQVVVPSSVEGGGATALIDSPRSMSVIKHRCHGLTAIA
jgi:hypothetical protein